eukprot:gene3107-3575_t
MRAYLLVSILLLGLCCFVFATPEAPEQNDEVARQESEDEDKVMEDESESDDEPSDDESSEMTSDETDEDPKNIATQNSPIVRRRWTRRRWARRRWSRRRVVRRRVVRRRWVRRRWVRRRVVRRRWKQMCKTYDANYEIHRDVHVRRRDYYNFSVNPGLYRALWAQQLNTIKFANDALLEVPQNICLITFVSEAKGSANKFTVSKWRQRRKEISRQKIQENLLKF